MASAQTQSSGPFLVSVDAPDGYITRSFTFTGVAVDCSTGQAATRIAVYDGPDPSTTPIATGSVDTSRSVASFCPNLPNNGQVNAGFNIVVPGEGLSDGQHTLTFIATFPSGDSAATNVVAVAANRNYGYGYGDPGYNPMYDSYYGGYPGGSYYGGGYPYPYGGSYYGGYPYPYGSSYYGGSYPYYGSGYNNYYGNYYYPQSSYYCAGQYYYPGQRADAPRYGCMQYQSAGYSSYYGYPQGFPNTIYVACGLCVNPPSYQPR
jgi:hypothetical protein